MLSHFKSLPVFLMSVIVVFSKLLISEHQKLRRRIKLYFFQGAVSPVLAVPRTLIRDLEDFYPEDDPSLEDAENFAQSYSTPEEPDVSELWPRIALVKAYDLLLFRKFGI